MAFVIRSVFGSRRQAQSVTRLTAAQAIVLDDHPDGNFLELWTIFTGRPLLRLRDLLNDADQARAFAETPRNLIIPLAGAANLGR